MRFEVIRDDKKAYHLSEGECSLLAFCYFMAKLEDIDTKGSKPIIWIDDPISSLDSNHIFFIYSLINEKIVNNHIFGQLFISPPNLVHQNQFSWVFVQQIFLAYYKEKNSWIFGQQIYFFRLKIIHRKEFGSDFQ